MKKRSVSRHENLILSKFSFASMSQALVLLNSKVYPKPVAKLYQLCYNTKEQAPLAQWQSDGFVNR